MKSQVTMYVAPKDMRHIGKCLTTGAYVVRLAGRDQRTGMDIEVVLQPAHGEPRVDVDDVKVTIC